MPENPNEDLIEATIRRVAEEKAARAAREDSQPEPDDEPVAARPVLPVDESIAPVFAPGGGGDTPPAADEDLIEATIRRVAEAKAARESDDDAVSDALAPEADLEPEEVAPPTRLRDLWEQSPRRTTGPAPTTAWAPPPERSETQVSGADTDALLREVLLRLDAVLPLLERLVATPQPAAPAGRTRGSDEDEWEATPQVSQLPSALPRPVIFRDPSPQTATAQLLEPEPAGQVIDTRPLPQPLPPIHAEPRRGLDLLPRTYRLTVEDKRRGVDLVPLHRALLGMEGVRDMSLLSYNNGVAIVSIETTSDLEADVLERAVSRAMARNARVEVHNEFTMVVKLGEE